METTTAGISTAFRIEDEAKIGFWDELIVAAAIKADADRILSEDLNAVRRISGRRLQLRTKNLRFRPSRLTMAIYGRDEPEPKLFRCDTKVHGW